MLAASLAVDPVTPPLYEVLSVAQEAALLAGRHIQTAWVQRGEVKATKSNATDLVTETDQRCEELVIELRKSKFPGHQIIGEESAGASKYELTDAPTWTIDPIDGTTNFVHRLALSCVIISYICKREVLVGVVYDPMADELFWATRGGGAFLRGRAASVPSPIHVSETKCLQQAVISMDPGYGRDAEAVARFCASQSAILRRSVRNIRVLGSTGLNMAYVACGRLDAGFEDGSWDTNLGPKIWDFAAGKLLVEEAGGISRDLSVDLSSRRPLDLLQRCFFCASSESLAEELLEAIAEGRIAQKSDLPHSGCVEGVAKRQKL
ncbi:unnamed protein product [Polarella glacialis]|uniref:Inositol-1-monophosphatase n=1 Tax=Polarella glacialis TaxID=89957 RepID=A0A813JU69_POLGL|nr:unnamed protein product [Polarella glacialis]